MPTDIALRGAPPATVAAPVTPHIAEAGRQLDICNACRYCEGYCAVFPSMTLHRSFAAGDITQLANLCHNCRGCYYACQYTDPHEFALNLPRALAKVRVETWERLIRPAGLARMFQARGMALAGALVLCLALILWLTLALRPESGEGFYAHMSHGVMAGLFLAASVLPFVVIQDGLRRYWREVGGTRITLGQIRAATQDAARLRNLSGGAAEGCNYEREDRFTRARHHAHQAMMWGFLLCFVATSAGTVLHYVFDMPAPYPLFSLPKLFGIPGGILMVAGGIGLVALKLRADRDLGAPSVWGGETAMVVLLIAIAASGLALYAATGTGAVRPLLILHLATVLAFFLTLPYTKMVHAPFRFAALLRDAQTRQTPPPASASAA